MALLLTLSLLLGTQAFARAESTTAPDADRVAALEAEIEALREERDELAKKLAGVVEGTVGDSYVAIGSAMLTEDIYGKPCILVNYSWSHDKDDITAFVWAVEALAFQNGIECAVAYDVPGLDVSLATRNVKKGATLELQRAYYLQNTTSPVEIEVREGYVVGKAEKFSRIYELPLEEANDAYREDSIETQEYFWEESGVGYMAIVMENVADRALDTTLRLAIEKPTGESTGNAVRNIGTLQPGEKRLCVFSRNQDLSWHRLNIIVESGKSRTLPTIAHTLVYGEDFLQIVLDNQSGQYAENVACDVLFFQGSDVVRHGRVTLEGKLEAGATTIAEIDCSTPFDKAIVYVSSAAK